jgi:hypothetical protein
VAPFDETAEPAAEARNPTSGIANAATATTTTAMKIAFFVFIVLSLSKVSEVSLKQNFPETES